MPNNGIAYLVRQFYDRLWNAWDDNVVDRTLAADFTFRGSLGQSTCGRDEWRAYRDGIRLGAPDFHNDVVDLIVDGHRAAARLQFSGTHTGLLLSQPPTGRTFTYSGAAFFIARGELLTGAWVLGDLESLRAQLVA